MLDEEPFDIRKDLVTVDRWQSSSFIAHEVAVNVLRLDKIHPVISGNKWFKLKNYLSDALSQGSPSILSFGGAYSNHIVATSYAAKAAGLQSIGIIRGEPSGQESPTLKIAIKNGMQLHQISRDSYKNRDKPDFLHALTKKYPGAYIVPEGGEGQKGMAGCKDLLQWIGKSQFSHILCAVGTGTFFSGIVNACVSGELVEGICILKGMADHTHRYNKWISAPERKTACRVHYDYHFGGYAKKTPELIEFMNHLYSETGIPTDFVYTGKLFYASFDLIIRRHFPKGSKLLIIHSGGLQGNLSLPKGTLIYENE
jgi:1-aminocyclopropane-1-carboxylate deaminase